MGWAAEPGDPAQNEGSQCIPGRECGADAGVCAAAPYWPVPYRPISAGWQRGTDYPAPAKAIALQQEAAAAPETGGKSKTKTAGNQGFAFVSGGFGGDKRDRTTDLLNGIQALFRYKRVTNPIKMVRRVLWYAGNLFISMVKFLVGVAFVVSKYTIAGISVASPNINQKSIRKIIASEAKSSFLHFFKYLETTFPIQSFLNHASH